MINFFRIISIFCLIVAILLLGNSLFFEFSNRDVRATAKQLEAGEGFDGMRYTMWKQGIFSKGDLELEPEVEDAFRGAVNFQKLDAQNRKLMPFYAVATVIFLIMVKVIRPKDKDEKELEVELKGLDDSSPSKWDNLTS